MTSSGQTICLCMIVKNEAPVIRRCLDSIRPLIDHWLIVDTGSADGTQAIVREHFRDMPGELVERPWRDFAHNRTEALALARPLADYTLIIDADDTFVVPAGFWLPPLDADSYTVDVDFGPIRYQRPQLVRSALGWRYEGVIHEYLVCEDARTSGSLPLVLRIHQDGARRRDPETYSKDAALLERAIAEETDAFRLARYTFYLAQSYRDSGQGEKAVPSYLRRAEMGFWDQEIYCSLLYAGRLMQAMGRDAADVLDVFGRATRTVPTRAEALHASALVCRGLQRYGEGHAFARRAAELDIAASGLFVEAWIYDYGALDELAVNAFWAGHDRECLDACLRALKRGRVPTHEQPRFLDNMRFALDRMSVDRAAVSSSMPRPRTSPPTLINLGSGKDYRDDHLNIDVDPTWRPDAVLDLSAIVLGPEGVALKTSRFGHIVLSPGSIDGIMANDVLEHVPNLVALMTTCLALLKVGGTFRISVPYDLSFGAWQDPTHVRTFNERSWLYYTEWFWYLGWRNARFVVASLQHMASPLGEALRARGVPEAEVIRTARAIDSMSVTLRKVDLSEDDLRTLAHWRDRQRLELLPFGLNRPE